MAGTATTEAASSGALKDAPPVKIVIAGIIGIIAMGLFGEFVLFVNGLKIAGGVSISAGILFALKKAADTYKQRKNVTSMRELKNNAREFAVSIAQIGVQIINLIMLFTASRKGRTTADEPSPTTRSGGQNTRSILTDADYTSEKVLANPDTASRIDKLRYTYSDDELKQLFAKGRDQKKGIGSILDGIEGKSFQTSKCSPDELYLYLKKISPSAGEKYRATGVFPQEIQIPRDPKFLTSDGAIDWRKYAPEGGYVLDGTKKAIKSDYTPYIGEVIDRYGPPNGRYTSPVIDGKAFTYEQRALPFVEDKNIYHQYVIQQNIKDIEEIVKRITDGNVKRRVEGFMRSNGLTYSDLKVKKGIINSAFKSVGGGIQYEFPLPIELLESIGILKQIN